MAYEGGLGATARFIHYKGKVVGSIEETTFSLAG